MVLSSRPRFSKLSYAGSRKMTRLPRRSAIVAFSAAEVYQLAARGELKKPLMVEIKELRSDRARMRLIELAWRLQ